MTTNSPTPTTNELIKELKINLPYFGKIAKGRLQGRKDGFEKSIFILNTLSELLFKKEALLSPKVSKDEFSNGYSCACHDVRLEITHIIEKELKEKEIAKIKQAIGEEK